MNINFKGDKNRLQDFISMFVSNAFLDACDQLYTNKIDGGDFYYKWYEIIPVLFTASHIFCRKYLSDQDMANLDDAIKYCIFNTTNPNGYHYKFSINEFKDSLRDLPDFDRLSEIVFISYTNYTRIAGSFTDRELAECEAIMSQRMSNVEGDYANTQFVLRRVLQEAIRHVK